MPGGLKAVSLPPSIVGDLQLPMTEAERMIHAEKVANLFRELDALPDTDPPGTDEQFMRNVDETRLSLSMRPIFEGYY